MFDLDQLDRLKYTEIDSAATDKLVDIVDVRIGGTTAGERLDDFLKQIANPYHYKVGNTPIHITFMPDGKPLEEKLKAYFLFIKQNAYGAQIKE